MKLTRLWIDKQERPCEFQLKHPSFTITIPNCDGKS